MAVHNPDNYESKRRKGERSGKSRGKAEIRMQQRIDAAFLQIDREQRRRVVAARKHHRNARRRREAQE